jgi:hypothetical protein
MSKQRLEALSDGVIAIAITLLILEIKVPEGAGEALPRAPRSVAGRCASRSARRSTCSRCWSPS